MARAVSTKTKLINTAVAGTLGFMMFFPILWMVLTSFKPEQLALAMPPRIFFVPTLENYRVALFESPYLEFLWNTLVITGLSTLAALLLGVPIAYAMAFFPLSSVLIFKIVAKLIFLFVIAESGETAVIVVLCFLAAVASTIIIVCLVKRKRKQKRLGENPCYPLTLLLLVTLTSEVTNHLKPFHGLCSVA